MGIGQKRNQTRGVCDRRIEIQQATDSRSSTGQSVSTWSRFTKAWAKIDYKDAGAGEFVFTDQIVAQTPTNFTIPYQSGINEKMRISYGGDYFNITNIQEVGRKAYLLLKTEKQE